MAHYSRPVKPGIDLVAAYPDSGTVVIHAAGCSHASRTVRAAVPVTYDADGVYGDDWYQVAPCAANGKGRVCTRYGSACNC